MLVCRNTILHSVNKVLFCGYKSDILHKQVIILWEQDQGANKFFIMWKEVTAFFWVYVLVCTANTTELKPTFFTSNLSSSMNNIFF